MPKGVVRTDLNTTGTSYKDGTPVTLPHTFGTPVTLPHTFGNVEPVADQTLAKNAVTWQPTPTHFGNIFNPIATNALELENGNLFELEDGSGLILLEA